MTGMRTHNLVQDALHAVPQGHCRLVLRCVETMDAWDFGKRKANESEERRKSIHKNFERCSFDVRPAPGYCLLSSAEVCRR